MRYIVLFVFLAMLAVIADQHHALNNLVNQNQACLDKTKEQSSELQNIKISIDQERKLAIDSYNRANQEDMETELEKARIFTLNRRLMFASDTIESLQICSYNGVPQDICLKGLDIKTFIEDNRSGNF